MATFDESEIESIREIIQVNTNANTLQDLSSRLTALNEAQADACRKDIGSWNKIADGTVKSRGGIKGTDFDIERDRLHITNKMRLRLNYPRISGNIDRGEMGVGWMKGTSWAGGLIEDEFSR